MGEWIIGAFINLFGSIAINFGTNLLKLGHNERERHSVLESDGTSGKLPLKPIIYFHTWRVGILFFLLGNCLNFISFGYAAQSLLAALGSIQFVSNIAFAYFVLNKMVTVNILVATAFIVLGNIFLVAFGNHQSPVYTPEQLAEKYSNISFLLYCLILIVIVALHHSIYRRGELMLTVSGHDLRPFWHMLLPFSYAIVSGAVGSCSVLFAKSLSNLLRLAMYSGYQLHGWFTYSMLLLFLSTAGFWMTRLNEGLSLFDAILIVPMFQIAWTFFSICTGFIYFQEYQRLQPLHHSCPALKPFLLFPKCPPSPSYCFNSNLRRKFSSTPLYSTSDSHESQSSSSTVGSGESIVGDLLDYLNESWTQFHAAAEAKRQLIDAGFHLLNENDEWDLKPGGRYFFTRNMSSLVAFAIGEKYAVGNGFHVIAAHTDSPCLKLKPKSASSKTGYLMVNVQTYGGGLWHTWFDRDLSVAGRVIVRGSNGSFVHKLVKVKRPLLRIPTLAIHLDSTVNKDGFKPNLETHLIPLLSTKLEETSLESKEKSTASSSKAAHHPLIMQALSDELNCSIDDIVSIELNVCDTQPSCLGGGKDEFIFSGRLDNLASSYCALRALIDSCKSSSDLSSEHAIRMVALFDNEEVGSDSVQGAGAPTMFQAMRRIVSCLVNKYVGEGAFERAIRHSFLVSADMAHGVHPNFMDKHEEHHRPEMQKGLVIKHNANQRYATSGVTAFLFKEVGKIHNLPTQEFVVRNDMGCGSTIGPILASGVGIRTVDCGIAQLSMHSVREICGKEDVDIAYKHFKAFYQTFSSIDRKLNVDF